MSTPGNDLEQFGETVEDSLIKRLAYCTHLTIVKLKRWTDDMEGLEEFVSDSMGGKFVSFRGPRRPSFRPLGGRCCGSSLVCAKSATLARSGFTDEA